MALRPQSLQRRWLLTVFEVGVGPPYGVRAWRNHGRSGAHAQHLESTFSQLEAVAAARALREGVAEALAGELVRVAPALKMEQRHHGHVDVAQTSRLGTVTRVRLPAGGPEAKA